MMLWPLRARTSKTGEDNGVVARLPSAAGLPTKILLAGDAVLVQHTYLAVNDATLAADGGQR